MKFKIKHLCILLLAAATLGFFSGCATAPGGVDSLKITRNNIDWAMVHYHNRADFGFADVSGKNSGIGSLHSLSNRL